MLTSSLETRDQLHALATLYDGFAACASLVERTLAAMHPTVSGALDATERWTLHDWLARPDFETPWNTWQASLTRDLVGWGAASVYVRRGPGGTLNGPVALEAVSAPSLLLLVDGQGRTPTPPYPAYYQHHNGVTLGAYTTEDILYTRISKYSQEESVYAWGLAEQLLARVNHALRSGEWDVRGATDWGTPRDEAEAERVWNDLLAGSAAAARRLSAFVRPSRDKLNENPWVGVLARHLWRETLRLFDLDEADARAERLDLASYRRIAQSRSVIKCTRALERLLTEAVRRVHGGLPGEAGPRVHLVFPE